MATATLNCPMCKKALEARANPCPRCHTDLTLLVDFMSNLDEHLTKADDALKRGELGEAVWAYLNVLETDPDHDVARRQVSKVATAVRQFDEAKRSGRNGLLMFGAGLALAALLLLGGTFYLGYQFGTRGESTSSASP
jgi:hypothetical protein